MTILAVGAHPDDSEFQCAGTLAKYAQRGDRVFIAIPTNGEAGTSTGSGEETARTRWNTSGVSASMSSPACALPEVEIVASISDRRWRSLPGSGQAPTAARAPRSL